MPQTLYSFMSVVFPRVLALLLVVMVWTEVIFHFLLIWFALE